MFALLSILNRGGSVLRGGVGVSEEFVKTSEIPEGFRKFKRNYRDGIDPEVTAAVPAEQFRGILWNSFRGRESRPTLVGTLQPVQQKRARCI